jgi:hypothetical protein
MRRKVDSGLVCSFLESQSHHDVRIPIDEVDDPLEDPQPALHAAAEPLGPAALPRLLELPLEVGGNEADQLDGGHQEGAEGDAAQVVAEGAVHGAQEGDQGDGLGKGEGRRQVRLFLLMREPVESFRVNFKVL